MKKLIVILSLGAVVATAGETSASDVKVETTMPVARCQALLKDGTQCRHQVENAGRFCWRHRGAVKAIDETLEDAGKGADKAWKSTKTWSTNVWDNAKTGAKNAWAGTKEAFDDARVGLVELLGGKDAAEKKDGGKK